MDETEKEQELSLLLLVIADQPMIGQRPIDSSVQFESVFLQSLKNTSVLDHSITRSGHWFHLWLDFCN